MKHLDLSIISLIGLSISACQVVYATDDATNTLPNAKPGECYAKVVLPATYKTETNDIVAKEASEKITIIPAKYEWVKEKVLVKEASKKVVPVKVVYGEVTEKIQLNTARKYWVTSLNKNAIPASSALLNSATKGGVNLAAAAPGHCFVESYVPAKFETKVEKVLIRQASESLAIIPAKYGMVEEKILVKQASTKVVEVPATYETVTEKVLVEPAKTIWKKGKGLAQRIDNTTGEIMCLIEVPAKYKTVTKRIIKTKATTKVIDIPAEYNAVSVRKLLAAAEEKRTSIPEEYTTIKKSVKVSDEVFSWHTPSQKPNAILTGSKVCLKETLAQFKTVSKRVVKTPATTTSIDIAAEYKFIKVRKLVSAAQEKRVVIPAKMQTVSKRIKVGEERLEWRQVLCQTNMTNGLIAKIQKALMAKGFNPGPIDGEIGTGTMSAVDAYQQKNNLERGGLTLDTIKKLGVNS